MVLSVLSSPALCTAGADAGVGEQEVCSTSRTVVCLEHLAGDGAKPSGGRTIDVGAALHWPAAHRVTMVHRKHVILYSESVKRDVKRVQPAALIHVQ
jgi:hypothetical protein